MGIISPERVPALGKAFRREDLFVEHTLRTIAVLVGIDEASISTGCNYLVTEGMTRAGMTTFRFRTAQLARHHAAATGPTRFVAPAYHSAPLLAVGGKMTLSASVHNIGGASRGLCFTLHGPAIEQKLVDPEDATLCIQERRVGPRRFVRTIENGRETFVADFPEFEISAANGRRIAAPQNIYGFVSGRALAVGRAPIHWGSSRWGTARACSSTCRRSPSWSHRALRRERRPIIPKA
ncbi:MAG TPA: hypothetical protein VM925_11475 [Labilithrix sp.]|nr:hypothetical protein [Labilithrix sp.]